MQKNSEWSNVRRGKTKSEKNFYANKKTHQKGSVPNNTPRKERYYIIIKQMFCIFLFT